jgi:hypothetical protein
MKTLLLSLLLTLPLQSFAHINDWTQEQKNWYIAANVLILADWATTRNMSKRYDEGYHESNTLFLNKHPSSGRIDGHFLTVLAANYFIADSLGKHRTLYLQAYTIKQAHTVSNNLSLGLQIKF